MEKTLFFGGSFNPIHNGHLICCRAAAEAAGFDRIVLIPAGISWQKASGPEMAKPQQRIEMIRLAIGTDDLFGVDPIEIERGGLTYTVDTAQQLLDRGEPDICWLIGADTLSRLSSWHDAARLLRLVQFHVMQRPGTVIDLAALPIGCRATPLRTPAIDISATDIRRRVSMNQPINFLTPDPVVRYIADHGLYRHS